MKGRVHMAEEIRVSTDFIIKHLPSAPPLYVSVYLMTLAIGEQDVADVAARLDILQSDVLRAWKYWREKGVAFQEGTVTLEAQSKTSSPSPVAIERKPEYSPAEMAEYMKHQDIKRLLKSAQKTLGKMLTQQDVSTLFSFYDWLGLPIEVIEVLLSYCVTNGSKGMRYIEKVAIGWSEEGINTVEKAGEYIEMRKVGYRAIMQSFGQAGRMPVEAEEGFMKKWLKEYGFSLDVIKEACARTVLQTGKVSFPYADSVLCRWKDSGVRDKDDIATLDQAFAAKKAMGQEKDTVTKKDNSPKGKKNRFINFTQREWNLDEIEQMERKNRDKW